MRDGLHQGGMSGRGTLCPRARCLGGGETCPPTLAKEITSSLFRTHYIVRSPYAIALALFFAVRSRSPSRTFCPSSLLILPYGLPAQTVFAPDVFLPDAGVVLLPPPVTILPARRQSAFPSLHTSSQTSPISSTYKCPIKFELHVDIRMRKTVPARARRGVTLKVLNKEMEKWEIRKLEMGIQYRIQYRMLAVTIAHVLFI